MQGLACAVSSWPGPPAYQLHTEGQMLGLWQGLDLLHSEGVHVRVPASDSRVCVGGRRCCEPPSQPGVLLAGLIPTHVAVFTEVLLQGIKVWALRLCLSLLLTLLS